MFNIRKAVKFFSVEALVFNIRKAVKSGFIFGNDTNVRIFSRNTK